MKIFLLSLVLLLASCTSTSNQSSDAELTGILLSSFVNTQSGLSKGYILHLYDSSEINEVEAVANGNPKKVLLVYPKPKSLGLLVGRNVKVSGALNAAYADTFQTDFELKVKAISMVN